MAALANGDTRMAVAGDGTILEGTLTKDLPTVPVSSAPGGQRLTEPKARRWSPCSAPPPLLLGRIAASRSAMPAWSPTSTGARSSYFGARPS